MQTFCTTVHAMQADALRRISAKTKVPLAVLVREALSRYLADEAVKQHLAEATESPEATE